MNLVGILVGLAGILATLFSLSSGESQPPAPVVEVTVNTHQPPAADSEATTPPGLAHKTPPGDQEQAGEV